MRAGCWRTGSQQAGWLRPPRPGAARAALAAARKDFEGAMRALAALRAPGGNFFLYETVNADDTALRLNRLRLLGELRDAVHAVADFSKVAG